MCTKPQHCEQQENNFSSGSWAALLGALRLHTREMAEDVKATKGLCNNFIMMVC